MERAALELLGLPLHQAVTNSKLEKWGGRGMYKKCTCALSTRKFL